jgi:hypothetical protein
LWYKSVQRYPTMSGGFYDEKVHHDAATTAIPITTTAALVVMVAVVAIVMEKNPKYKSVELTALGQGASDEK